MLMRLGALLTIGLAGLAIMAPMPGAGANESADLVRDGVKGPLPDPMRLLLSPAPLSSERFMAYYVIAYH